MFGNDFQTHAMNARIEALEKKLHDMESKVKPEPIIMFPMRNVTKEEFNWQGWHYWTHEVPREKDIREVVQMILDHLKLEFAVEPATKEEISLKKIGKQ